MIKNVREYGHGDDDLHFERNPPLSTDFDRASFLVSLKASYRIYIATQTRARQLTVPVECLKEGKVLAATKGLTKPATLYRWKNCDDLHTLSVQYL